MASFIIIPAKIKENELDIIENIRVNSISPESQNKNLLRSGIILDSFIKDENGIFFKYGFEYISKQEVLKDLSIFKKKIKLFKSFQIIILKTNLICIESKFSSNKELKMICLFIQNKIIKGSLANKLSFDDNFLRSLPEYYEMQGFDIEPIQGNNKPIDRISSRGKSDIKGTDFYEQFFDEPLKFVKIVKEGDERKDINVSFNSRGVIRIYNKNLESEQIIKILKVLTELIERSKILEKRERKVQTKINWEFDKPKRIYPSINKE